MIHHDEFIYEAPHHPRLRSGHDDAAAIVVAAHTCELLGITTVAGNAPLDRTTCQRPSASTHARP